MEFLEALVNIGLNERNLVIRITLNRAKGRDWGVHFPI